MPRKRDWGAPITIFGDATKDTAVALLSGMSPEERQKAYKAQFHREEIFSHDLVQYAYLPTFQDFESTAYQCMPTSLQALAGDAGLFPEALIAFLKWGKIAYCVHEEGGRGGPAQCRGAEKLILDMGSEYGGYDVGAECSATVLPNEIQAMIDRKPCTPRNIMIRRYAGMADQLPFASAINALLRFYTAMTANRKADFFSQLTRFSFVIQSDVPTCLDCDVFNCECMRNFGHTVPGALVNLFNDALGKGRWEYFPGYTTHCSGPEMAGRRWVIDAPPGQKLRIGGFNARMFEKVKRVFAGYLKSPPEAMWDGNHNEEWKRLKAEYCDGQTA